MREKREQLRDALVERLAGKGLKRGAVLETMDRLDTATAIALGLAVHAMANAGGVAALGSDPVARLLKATMGD